MKKFLLSITVFCAASVAFSQSPCSDLFISEYIEGTSSNKALEIYNPTPNPIDLSNYSLVKFFNGSTTANDTLIMSGMLAPGTTYNIVDPDSGVDAGLVALADTLHTVTFFNGDDPIYLYNGTTLIDVIGTNAAGDPGTNWVVGTGATSEYTLVRKATVQAGTTSWATGATQWDVFPQNTFSQFGNHAMNICTNSIEDETGWEMTIYPNPTSGILNITSEVNNYSLQIIDLTGKAVVNKTNLSESIQIDLTDLHNGIYLIKVNNGTHQVTKRVILKK